MALVLRCILFIASVGVDLLDSLLFTFSDAICSESERERRGIFLIQKLYFIRKKKRKKERLISQKIDYNYGLG